jgi:murein DD-endopeptidase MepM/ murein hydrolase activator NlpD
MTVPTLLIKSALLLSDEEVRKRIFRIIIIALSPIIVVLLFLISLASGTASHNVSAVQLCFQGGKLPSALPEEYQTYIIEMRDSFTLLDSCVSGVNAQTENAKTLDALQIKSVFYALHFGNDQPKERAVSDFVDCFVTYEDRTRTVTNEDDSIGTETYIVAVPITDTETVWINIQANTDIAITTEIQTNANAIYAHFQTTLPTATLVGADGFYSPLGAGWESRVSSEFGYRICPFHGRELHSGIDIAAPNGTQIHAALSGTVTKSYYSNSYGNYTIIDHGNGVTTAYAHQSKRLVNVGDKVEANQVIGLVGSTGNSTGPHLHFEVRVDGELQNPRNFLPTL